MNLENVSDIDLATYVIRVNGILHQSFKKLEELGDRSLEDTSICHDVLLEAAMRIVENST